MCALLSPNEPTHPILLPTGEAKPKDPVPIFSICWNWESTDEKGPIVTSEKESRHFRRRLDRNWRGKASTAATSSPGTPEKFEHSKRSREKWGKEMSLILPKSSFFWWQLTWKEQTLNSFGALFFLLQPPRILAAAGCKPRSPKYLQLQRKDRQSYRQISRVQKSPLRPGNPQPSLHLCVRNGLAQDMSQRKNWHSWWQGSPLGACAHHTTIIRSERYSGIVWGEGTVFSAIGCPFDHFSMNASMFRPFRSVKWD